ncbi:MAG TPA: ABC transporter ATP-binding protein [Spirochaetia bacterium]|nr:ABC transporter ATP-binding protein [Spirochaetia bacterium]
MTPAVETRDLSYSYGSVRAVAGMDLRVDANEMFALVGPDGAGKTTTIRLLCGILPSGSGSVRIFGHDLTGELAWVKEHIGYLSQRFSLYGDLTVDENVEFFAQIHGVRDFHDRREELLGFTRLLPFRSRLADRLSGGMKQKLALACTLVHHPQIIFLDEPTTGVDPVSRREFWIILSQLLREGITIVMSTPYLDEAERASRVGLMSSGRLMAAESPARIKAGMKGSVLEIVCSDIRRASKVLRGLAELREVQLFGDRLNAVATDSGAGEQAARRALEEAGIAISSVRVIPSSLENAFISVIRSESEVAS